MTDAPNPFAVTTPDSFSAEAAVQLFVDVFTDFYSIRQPGHTFIHGPRGSGKSMMFRILEPDCQLLFPNKRAFDSLPFFSAYVPIKNTTLALTEMSRLANTHADQVVSEHALSLLVISRFLTSLIKNHPQTTEFANAAFEFYDSTFPDMFTLIGGGESRAPDLKQGQEAGCYLKEILKAILRLHNGVVLYLRSLAFTSEPPPYNGPLIGFLDFVEPFIRVIKSFPGMPAGPVFVLVDDADNLTHTQTQVLNSWVSTRTTESICLKVSTQLNYKTYLTSNGARIETPHDFSEIYITGVYTTKKSRYHERMRSIVEKRLQSHGLESDPDRYFPQKKSQEEKIEKIRKEYLANPTPRGFNARDDANRYSRPDYIRDLSKKRGGLARYSYSGFSQLVHVSSGVVRHFLDAAALMYADELAKDPQRVPTFIPPAVQDRIVRDRANAIFFIEFEKSLEDSANNDKQRQALQKLHNMIESLGTMFQEILISEVSERRVFSIALSEGGTEESRLILRLGVKLGYFHEATIGAKNSAGRVPLFILTRRLAPLYTLDPTSFSGYQFLSNEKLELAMRDPKAFVSRLKQSKGIFDNGPQLRLPLEEDSHD